MTVLGAIRLGWKLKHLRPPEWPCDCWVALHNGTLAMADRERGQLDLLRWLSNHLDDSDVRCR